MNRIEKAIKHSGAFAINVIGRMHKKLGHSSENPPILIADASDSYRDTWAQVWVTGMDWNAYYYMVDSDNDEPRLIAVIDDIEGKGAHVKSDVDKKWEDATDIPNRVWKETAEKWVRKHANPKYLAAVEDRNNNKTEVSKSMATKKSPCDRYKNEDGSFKNGFDGAVKYFMCQGKSKESATKMAGKIAAEKGDVKKALIVMIPIE